MEADDAVLDAQTEYDACVVAWNAAVDSRCHEQADYWCEKKAEAFERLFEAIRVIVEAGPTKRQREILDKLTQIAQEMGEYDNNKDL